MKTILVIEDNKDVRENIAEILELSKYNVLTATNGKEGVEVATKETPDLIVCDIMMPELDGYAVLNLLNRNKETFGVPFIFLTAKSEKIDFRKAMEMGADDYLTKPFTRSDLLKAIEARLKKSESIKTIAEQANKNINEFITTVMNTSNVQLVSNEREVYDFKKKDIVYTEGNKPKAVYYLVKGKVKVYKSNEDGKELITNIHTSGDFFGYNCVLENISHPETAKVLEDAEIMFIAVEDFISLLVNDTQVARQFIKIITKNILEKEQRLIGLAYNSLRKKVAYGLMQVYDKYKNDENNNGTLVISRENLAQLIGVATESLIRTLADFKTEKIVDIEASKVIILDEQRLREMPN